MPCQSGCCQLFPSIAPPACRCCSRGTALSSHRSPQQAHCWGGGGPVTARRRRRTTQKPEKKVICPNNYWKNPESSCLEQKDPMPQALGLATRTVGEAAWVVMAKKGWRRLGARPRATISARLCNRQDGGFRWYLQQEVEPKRCEGPPPTADLSTRRLTALASQFIILRFETIQEGCRCLQEEREGGGGVEGWRAAAGLLGGCRLLETARPRTLLRAMKLIWGRMEHKRVMFPPGLDWEG